MSDHDVKYAFCEGQFPMAEPEQRRNFMGYRRSNGKVGTRNYLGIISSVNYSATVVRAIGDYFAKRCTADFQNVDGVVSLPQFSGCAMDIEGDLMHIMRRVMGGYVYHPNFAGVLTIGLGGESNQTSDLVALKHLSEDQMHRNLAMQEQGGTRKTIVRGIEYVEEMFSIANKLPTRRGLSF